MMTSPLLSLGLFEPPASLLAWFYSITHNYILAISLIALVVMIVTAPLVLKSTKACSKCRSCSRRCVDSSNSTAVIARR